MYKNDNSSFLTFGVIPLCFVWNRFCVCYVTQIPLCHMRKAKDMMSVHMRAVWSGHSLFVDIFYSIHWLCKRTIKAQISCTAAQADQGLHCPQNAQGPFLGITVHMLEFWTFFRQHSFIDLVIRDMTQVLIKLGEIYHWYQKSWWNNIYHFHSLGYFSRRQIHDVCLIFPRKQDLTFHANWRQFAWNAKSFFSVKIRTIFQNIVTWKFYPECLALTLSLPQAIIIDFCKQDRSRWDSSMSHLIWNYTIWHSVF